MVFFIAFMASLAAALLGLVSPFLSPERKSLSLPSLRLLLLMAAAAGLGLAADWIVHSL